MNAKTQSTSKIKAPVETRKLVTFQLGVDRFAADVLSVERVVRYDAPAAVPDAPAWIDGVLEHRGAVIPVVDMRRRIEIADTSITQDTRILILTTADGLVGAVVDAVHEVAAVPASTVAPPPALFRGLASEFVTGIVKLRDQLVVILNVDRVLTSGDRIAFECALAAAGAEPAVRG